ncbi:MAG TPA: hypothetical protein VII11_05970 [Bacteroidota bacterium]
MFPSVVAADTKSGLVISDTDLWVIDYPTNLENGDLIILIGCTGVSRTFTISPPEGWFLATGNLIGNVGTRFAAKKKANGTETGTFNLDPVGAAQGVWRTIRIINWEGNIGTIFDNSSNAKDACQAGGAASTSTSPDPASVSPAFGQSDTLWIAYFAADHGDTTTTAFPTGYTQEDHTTSGGHAQESGGADGAAIGVAYRQLNAVSENPGNFTIDQSEEWLANLIAVRGPQSGLYVHNISSTQRW